MNNEKTLWAFLSHSSDDLAKVRNIRNICEAHGIDALMFNLRCLANGTEKEKELLTSLIHEEIKARDWFFLCKSESTGGTEEGTWKRKWVKEEWDYINTCKKHNQIIFDIEKDDLPEIERKIALISDSLSEIFLSYSHYDAPYADMLYNELTENGFSVYWDKNMPIDSLWLEQMEGAIDNSKITISLITENSIKSQPVERELLTILKKNKRCIPVFIDMTTEDYLPEIFAELKTFQCVFCSSQDFLTTVRKVIIELINDILNSKS